MILLSVILIFLTRRAFTTPQKIPKTELPTMNAWATVASKKGDTVVLMLYIRKKDVFLVI